MTLRRAFAISLFEPTASLWLLFGFAVLVDEATNHVWWPLRFGTFVVVSAGWMLGERWFRRHFKIERKELP